MITNIAVSLAFALTTGFIPSVVHAQAQTKETQKAFQDTEFTNTLYPNVEAACSVNPRVLSFLQVYNYTNVDTIHCGPGQTSTQTTVGTGTRAGTRESTQFAGTTACLTRHTTEITTTGACGTFHSYDESTGEQGWIREVRYCDTADGWNMSDPQTCTRPDDTPAKDCPACGNPTSVASGTKQETYALGAVRTGSKRIPIELRYGNLFGMAGGRALGEQSWFLEPVDRRLNLGLATSPSKPRVYAARGHGTVEEFHLNPDGSYRSFDAQVTLVQQGDAWMRTDYDAQTVEKYDGFGRLTQLRYFSGEGYDVSFPQPGVAVLTTMTGRSVQFNDANGRLANVGWPDGHATTLDYQDYNANVSGSYLRSIDYVDGTRFKFAYAPGVSFSISAGGGIPADGKAVVPVATGTSGGGMHVSGSADALGRALFNLSGVSDERDVSFSQFAYDERGRVKVSQRAQGTYVHEFLYQPGQTRVTLPLGSATTFSLASFGAQQRVTGVVRTAAGFAHAQHFGYDTAGNRVRRTDTGMTGADYKTQCVQFDAVLNRPILVVSGLTRFDCPADLNAYVPTDVERKTWTQWHPDRRLETRVAEPGRITTLVYNGQPDPFNGNAAASCAPATAPLPDGKPIAVLCKRVEQATTDTNGQLGFGAPLQNGVAPRTTRWTYNAWGQVLTEDGPRTDINDVTTYTYYTDTTADHAPGDLKQVTDAAGRTTQFTKYDKYGQVLESLDANNVPTLRTYDLRQRLKSTSVGGRMTRYDYDAVGLLKKITQADTSWLGYDYDDAHRLIAVYDHKGNRTDYVLDNAGNRIGENTKDPGGVLKRQLDRSMDALGRVQQTTGRE